MSDKERLENMSTIGFDLDGNVLIKGEDFHWLMEQAERVQELENHLKIYDFWYRTAYEQNKRYREALEEIARGRFPGASYKARKALEGEDYNE